MPRIPTYDLPQVSLEAPPIPQLSPEAAGAGIGRALQGLGAQIQRSASVAEEHVLRFQREQNENAAFEASSMFTRQAAELETEFSLLEGNQQAQQYPEFVKRVQALRDQTLASAPNDYTRRLLQHSTEGRFENILTGASRSAALKNREYIVNSTRARMELAVQDAASGDDEKFGLSLGDLDNNLDFLKRTAGMSDSEVEVERRKYVSEAVITRGASLAKSDPMTARKLLTEMGHQMTPEARLRLKTTIDNELVTSEVKRAKDAIMAGQNPVSPLGSRPALDFIAQNEGTAGKGDYNATLDYGKWTGGERELTSMTLDEIDQMQSGMKTPENKRIYKGGGSSAAGRYQIVQTTLRGLRKEMGLKGTELFDEALQDRLAEQLIARRGYDPDNLKNEWAGLKKVASKTIAGAIQPPSVAVKPINPATTDAEFRSVVDQAREYARKIAPDLPEFEDRLIAGLETDFNVMKKVQKEEQDNRFDSLYNLVLPRSIQESGLTEIPAEYIDEFNLLPPAQKNTILGQMKENASPEKKVETPEQLQNYYRLLARRDEGLRPDEIAVANIATNRKIELYKDATKPREPQNTDIREIMGDLRPFLRSASISPDSENEMIFQGRMVKAIDFYKKENQGKAPTDLEIQQMAGQLLRQVTTTMPRGPWGIFGTGDVKQRAFEPKESQLEAIRQFYPDADEDEVRRIWLEEVE